MTVKEAPRGQKPSWGGYIPQLLGFDLCQRMRRILTDDAAYPYLSDRARQTIEARRADLGELLQRAGQAIQMDDGVGRWLTFAGGRVNHTIKCGLELVEAWKVVADNFQLRIEGAGVTHGTVEAAIAKLGSAAWWEDPETRTRLLARLPEYRLSRFQRCLPELLALEVVGRYLVDVRRTVAWLGGQTADAPSSHGG